MENKKITEVEMFESLQEGSTLLKPLTIRRSWTYTGVQDEIDARIEVSLPNHEEWFRFAVEAKSRATPKTIQYAISQARAATNEGEWPMILVPYLSRERLDELEQQGVSGIDLCGNGIVIVPGRLWVMRSGQPNLYRDSRPLSNPYRGRSAMVGRMLLTNPKWSSLKELAAAIQDAGIELSLPQASKAIRALEDDLIVFKQGGTISLREPSRLLDRLGHGWKSPRIIRRQYLRLNLNSTLVGAMSSKGNLKWAVTGESSVTHYTAFSQGGPLGLAVSDLSLALEILKGKVESVPNFADLQLIETAEPGYFFSNETDENAMRWASRLQTWLELQSGDARQREAAQDIRKQILKGLD